MKIRKKEKMTPILIHPNDTISLEYIDNFGHRSTVLEDIIDKSMIVNEAVIFEVEKGDFGENVKQGIGGAFLEVGK